MTIEQELIEFFKLWDFEKLSELMRDIIPLVDLFDTRIEKDLVDEFIADQDKQNVVLIRTAYLISILCDNHYSILSSTKIRHSGFFKRLQAEAKKDA